jgi:hypothetical protein
MKNLRLKSILYILLSVLITATGNADKALAFDATPPKLENCKVTPNILPASGGELVFTARITSVNGLDRTPVVRMFNKSMTRWIADIVSVDLISGDSKLGEYQGKVTVKANLAPDRYYVTFDPLWDVSQNRTQMIWCFDAFVDYAGYTPPKPSPSPTPTSTPKNAQPSISQENYDALVASNLQLRSQIASLQAQVKALIAIQNKYNKVCSSRVKPKGC